MWRRGWMPLYFVDDIPDLCLQYVNIVITNLWLVEHIMWWTVVCFDIFIDDIKPWVRLRLSGANGIDYATSIENIDDSLT